MRSYAHYGFRRFVLCLGYKAEVIKSFFLNYSSMNSDFTVDLKTNNLTVHSVDHDQDWEVTLAYTGELTMTGWRVARAAEKYLGDAQHFAVTYGDGLTDAELRRSSNSICAHGKIGTVLGVNPPSRFGELKLEDERVIEFDEKPEFGEKLDQRRLLLLQAGFPAVPVQDESCVLEREPLVQLARDGELSIFKHAGFWACMDTQRDRDYLNGLWASGRRPLGALSSRSSVR